MPIARPTEIPRTLKGWYDASNTSSLTVSDNNLTYWKDISGQLDHLDTIEGTNPKSGTRNINGKNVIKFNNDGAIYNVTSSIDVGIPQSTIAFLCSMDAFDGTVVSSRVTLDNAVRISSSGNVVVQYGSPGATTNSQVNVNGIYRIIAVYNGANSKLWVNGVSESVPTVSEDRILIAMIGSNGLGGGNYFDGTVGEVLIYEDALTDAEALDLDDYLYRKWIYKPQQVELDLNPGGYTRTTVTNGSTNTTIIGNTPENIIAGDLMFAVIHSASSVSTGNSLTPPAGWTEVANNYSNNGNFDTLTWLGWKVANTSESATHTWTVGVADVRDDQCTIFRVLGADTTNPIHANTVFSGGNTTDLSRNSPSITTTKNNTLALYIFGGKRSDWIRAEDSSYPNYTNGVFLKNTRDNSFGITSGFATQYLSTPTTTGKQIWSNVYDTTGAYSSSITIAFNEKPKYILQAERFKETGIYQSFSDNFNRANTESYAGTSYAYGGELGPDWDIIMGGFRITSNTFDATSDASYAKVAETTVNFSDDHEAEIRISAIATFDSFGPAVRVTSNGCYVINCDGFSDSVRRISYVSGTTRTTIGNVNIVPVVGDIVKLKVQGSTLTAYINGVQVDQVSNTAYSTGQPGIWYTRGNLSVSKGDNFYAVDLNATTPRKVMQIFEDGTIQAGWFSEKELLAQMKVHANSDIWVGGLKEV